MKANILVVDDTPENLRLLVGILTEQGYEVRAASDGEFALQSVRSTPPDLILLDIKMSDMDGYAVCKELKTDDRTCEIPVIFISALDEVVNKIKGFEVGGVDYITKPFRQEEVLARVKAHLTIQKLRKDLHIKNQELQASLESERILRERERKLLEDLRLNLSLSLPHELRTPLNIIMGFSNFLTDPARLPGPNKVIEYGKTIHKNGLRLYRLIENYLLYAKLQLLQYTSQEARTEQHQHVVNVKGIISPVAQQRAEGAGRQGDLVLELVDVSIRISPKNFEKILTELFDNAFKFSKPGTPVRVTTTVDEGSCTLCITDQGRGMTQEQIAAIGAFMQFERLQHEQQGMGLGLVISLLLARLEGIGLSIDSKPDQGTIVSITLAIL